MLHHKATALLTVLTAGLLAAPDPAPAAAGFEQGGIFVNDHPVVLPAVLAGRCHASPSAVPPNQARYQDGRSIALGEGEYFLIGDNVDASADSRLAGPSPASSLVGVVDFLYWPLSKARLVR